MKLEIGDVVYLKSNPDNLMTVSLVLNKEELIGFGAKSLKKELHSTGFSDGDVQCTWYDKNTGDYNIYFFKAAMLGKKT